MAKFKPSRYVPAIVAWSLLLFVTGAFYVLLIPAFIREYSSLGIILTVLESLLTMCVVSNFLMATIMDPGILPKACDTDEQRDDFRTPLYKNVEINGMSIRLKWCVSCHIYRPPRCSHCSVCNHCIENFDHHCPWVNNCIGRRNYRQFFIFLISLAIHMIAVFSFSLTYTLKMNFRESLFSKENVGGMIIMGIVGLLFVPIVGLTGFHMMLVSRARTTNEQVDFFFHLILSKQILKDSPRLPLDIRGMLTYNYFLGKQNTPCEEDAVQWTVDNGKIPAENEEHVYILNEHGLAQRTSLPKYDAPAVTYQKMTKQPDHLYLFDGISRDSSQITIATLPQTAQIHRESSMNTTLGSKCNLLEDCSAGMLAADDSMAAGTDQDDDAQASDDTQSMLKKRKDDDVGERFLAVLKDSSHKNARGSPRTTTTIVANGKNADKRELGKSQSLDKLESQHQHSDDETGEDIIGGSKIGGDRQRGSSLEICKRPASYTQSVQEHFLHHDSLQLLNNNSCDGGGSDDNSPPTTNVNDTKKVIETAVISDGSSGGDYGKKVKQLKFSEIRV